MSEQNTNLPTLYLGNNTTVNGNNWFFGNSNVFLNVLPTADNMVANKSYVDNLVSVQEKKIDIILDGASVSVENFKNFVDFVNNSQRENEAELHDSISDISFAITNEIIRSEKFEEEINESLKKEVNRAIEIENGMLNQLQEITSKLKENKISEDVKDLIIVESNRINIVEDEIEGLQISFKNDSQKNMDEFNKLDSSIIEIKSSVQFEVNRASNEESEIKNSIVELRELISNNSNNTNNSKGSPDNERILELEDKINRLYQYFFHNDSIPL